MRFLWWLGSGVGVRVFLHWQMFLWLELPAKAKEGALRFSYAHIPKQKREGWSLKAVSSKHKEIKSDSITVVV